MLRIFSVLNKNRTIVTMGDDNEFWYNSSIKYLKGLHKFYIEYDTEKYIEFNKFIEKENMSKYVTKTFKELPIEEDDYIKFIYDLSIEYKDLKINISPSSTFEENFTLMKKVKGNISKYNKLKKLISLKI